jgi:hypothetical protein
LAARRVVVVDVGLAKAFRCSTVFRFIAACFKRWDTVDRTGLFVGCEPTGAESITTGNYTTSSRTAGDFAGRGFLVESSNRAQRKRTGHKRAWHHSGEPTCRRESCACY